LGRWGSAAIYIDTITVFEDALLVLPTATMLHFANHSCDPNLLRIADLPAVGHE
jgi:hypothetical protein